MTAIAIPVLWHYRDALVPATEPEPATAPALAVDLAPVAAGPAPMLVAIGRPDARQIAAMTVPLATARGGAVHVVHVVERDVVAGEDAVDLETQTEAVALLDAAMAELREAGVPVSGEIVHSTGTHADVAARVMDRAARLAAGLIVIGADTGRPALHGGVAAQVVAHAPSHAIVLNPRAGALGRPIPTVAGEADARGLWHAT